MKRTWILAIFLSLAAAGCSHDGPHVIPPEIYDEPPAIVLTADEQGLLDAISGKASPAAVTFAGAMDEPTRDALKKLQPVAKSLLEKIIRQKNAYRATVRKHNDEARKYQTAKADEEP